MRCILAVLLAASVAHAQTPLAPDADPFAALALATDTSDAAFDAQLRIEQARLALARSERRAVTGWRHWRPQLDLFLSLSTRGVAFPAVSSQGYDPTYAALARWPGDTWGVTASWSLDQLLDRRPVQRADAAIALAEARISLHHARREQREAAARERVLARAERDAQQRRDEQARTDAARALLRVEAGFLARRLDLQRELLRLAVMTYEQGETDYQALTRQRAATLAAEHAVATNTARLDALDAGADPDLALADLDASPPLDLPPAGSASSPIPDEPPGRRSQR
jgi:hypothetical protein